MSSTYPAQAAPVPEESRFLWRLALAVFVVTVLIGLMNGQRVGAIDTQAERPMLLTHLHTGTVGWVTVGLFGALAWLFAQGGAIDAGAGRMMRLAGIAVGCYPIVFFVFYPGGALSSPALLAVFGTLALVGIVWMLVWTFGQSRRVPMTVARLAMLGATANLAIGALLGVLVEARFAGLAFPGNVNQGHPAMMTVGYILPAAFGFAAWWLGEGVEGRRSRMATIAVGMLVLGGLLAAVAAVGNMPFLFPPILLFQLAATVMFAIQMAPRVLGTSWLARSGERHVALAAVVFVVDVLFLVYMVINYFAAGLEPPRGLGIALVHTEFVGLMTNAILGTILIATAARREAIWPWADDVAFWGVNVGWIGFALVEAIGAPGLARLFTPIMGISLLIAVAALSMRLRGAEEMAVAPVPAAGGGA